ncbi:MAG: hypothetical protein VB108_06855 [Anaerolineaceae bacterium]|nr:hypothetical protein [Anaerolineaceae bacterium]
MNKKILEGAQIIVESWLKLRCGEKVLILFDRKYQEEANALAFYAEKAGTQITLQPLDEIVSDPVRKEGFGSLFRQYDVAVGASDYSLITTAHVITAARTGTRFLSLPLVTLNGRSMLTYDFIRMDPYEAKAMAEALLPLFEANETIHVTTSSGTDMRFRYRSRKTSALYGLADKPGKIASASFEIYVAIEEDHTEGTLILDGSLGKIGLVHEPLKIVYEGGRIKEIEDNKEGKRLQSYIENFSDHRICVTAEFGLGLNKLSRMEGHCYIEDESTYGTFHIGHGRNLSLGGKQDASGHFDLVVRRPNIWVGDLEIMREGELLECQESR